MRASRRSFAGRRRWAPWAHALLLLLFWHAFLASATHFHRTAPAPAGQERATQVGDGKDATGTADAGGHAQCLLCRLQRNFVADAQKESAPVSAPPTALLAAELPPSLCHVARPFSVPSGRAPPLA